MNKLIRVTDSSDFWSENPDRLYGQWYFDRNESGGFEYDYYISKYLQCVKKYGILTPYALCPGSSIRADAFFGMVQDYRDRGYYGIQSLYRTVGYGFGSDISLAHFSVLYVSIDGKIKLEAVSNIDYKYNNRFYSEFSEPPVDLINMLQKSKGRFPSPTITLKSDVFFGVINYQRHMGDFYNSHIETRILGDHLGAGIDNYNLAILNTPRFNSFLRDIKRLNEYFGNNFHFEGDEGYTTENGILLDGEILLYEDVYNLVPEYLRYPGFNMDMIRIDKDDYEMFCMDTKGAFHSLF